MTAPAQRVAVPMNDLSRAIERDREALRAATERVLDSGHVVLGPSTAAFEEALAYYVGLPHSIGLASGTDALELALKAAMPPGRNLVLTAANAGGYTSVAAKRAGLRVRYVDVDEDTLCASAPTVAGELTDEVGVVVVTHLYGNLTDIRGLVELCHSRGIRVVEDCAQAIGARRAEGFAGSFGDLAAVSFYPTKNLGAIGDGGAVLTRDDELAARVRQLRQYGWGTKYSVEIAGGVNSRLDDLQAAFLLARLPLLDGLNERRREIIGRYAAAADGGSVRVLPAEGEHHVAHLAIALSPRRDEVRAEFDAAGVQTDIHFPIPDHQQAGFAAEPQSLPVTERVAGEVFSLPCFPELTEDEIVTVCEAIAAVSRQKHPA